ncbi:MAG: CBASS cGAMP synthase [Pelobium sp.]
MANSHNLFLEYHQEISIGKNKKARMISSKEALRKRISKWFKDNHSDYEPKFYIQGSHKMKTGIRTKEDICDLDDGVYFFKEPDVTATTLQSWVKEAVNGYTSTDPEHRKKCVRSIFVDDYEIDHPIYYKVDGNEYNIAVKNIGFEDSDPKAMVEWFNSKKDKDGKLIRHVMYLKGWCDELRHKMPSGLAMSILAANALDNIVLNERDDITLRDILKEIKKELDRDFKCIVPAVPNDDLFKDFDGTNFLKALNDFIDDADKALKDENQLSSSKLWRNHLGKRFPEGKDENHEKNSRLASSIIAGAATSKPWACE